ncbi:hypothetical protein BH11BAC2_BH11BAC2_22860 [soil metagenome]
MKNLMLVVAFLMFLNITASAQKVSASKVPASVLTAFKTKFPTVSKVEWEIENTKEYEAGFKMNGVETSANFDESGKWLETETEIKISELPSAVQESLKNEFVGYKINEASKLMLVDKGNCYEAEVEKGEDTFDILFSPDGKVISKTKTEEEKKD